MTPDEAFDFRLHEDSPTILRLMQAFAGLEERFVRGICTGDWSNPDNPMDTRHQQISAFREETDDYEFSVTGLEVPDTVDEILEHLDRIHQEALDILAEITDDEFLTLRVQVPWGEEGTIERLLTSMVEREIHNRSELYFALREYGIPVSEMIIWGP